MAARPIDYHLRIAMGDMALNVCKMQTIIEQLQDEIEKLKAELEKKESADGI